MKFALRLLIEGYEAVRGPDSCSEKLAFFSENGPTDGPTGTSHYKDLRAHIAVLAYRWVNKAGIGSVCWE